MTQPKKPPEILTATEIGIIAIVLVTVFLLIRALVG